MLQQRTTIEKDLIILLTQMRLLRMHHLDAGSGFDLIRAFFTE